MTKPETRDDKAPEELPDREALSLIGTGMAGPFGAAAALTVLSDASTAVDRTEQSPDPERDEES